MRFSDALELEIKARGLMPGRRGLFGNPRARLAKKLERRAGKEAARGNEFRALRMNNAATRLTGGRVTTTDLINNRAEINSDLQAAMRERPTGYQDGMHLAALRNRRRDERSAHDMEIRRRAGLRIKR